MFCGRLVWLQIVRRQEFVKEASYQQQRSFELAPQRGMIYDRNLNELAVTIPVFSVFATPHEFTDSLPETAALLSSVFHTDPSDSFTSEQEILSRLNASGNFVWITRKKNAAIVNRVKDLNLRGLYVQKEHDRFYPDHQMAAQLLGSVGVEDYGLAGIEHTFDEDLRGAPGHVTVALDARRRVLGSVERKPLYGENLVLSIDENIQFIAEQSLSRYMEKTRALNGTIIVQDPQTGQILALASRPTFDPNDLHHASNRSLREPAVSDVYEPGASFKLVTYAAAIESHVTNPAERIDCQGGQIVVAGHAVHDNRYNGVLTTTASFWRSSKVAAIKLAYRLGSDNFYKYIRSFGFGMRSGVELPGETPGLLKPPSRWSTSTLGSIAIGQEIGVSPLQLISMVSTIVNGGTYLPPSILVERTDRAKGSLKLRPFTFRPNAGLPNPLPEGAHRVLSTLTSSEMRKILAGAELPDADSNRTPNRYRVAGIAGNAQKVDPATGAYSATKYVASAIGFAPANSPVISLVVVLNSPGISGTEGTRVSARMFHEVSQEILEYLGTPSYGEEVKPKATAIHIPEPLGWQYASVPRTK
jgi:cell division protein FtsI/penicillin-binding protein 2